MNYKKPSINTGDWDIQESDHGEYLSVTRRGSPGSIVINQEAEGFVVDAWAEYPRNDGPEATFAVFTVDMDNDQDDI